MKRAAHGFDCRIHRREFVGGALAALVVAPVAWGSARSMTIETRLGAVIGSAEDGCAVFKGIRYGQDTRHRRFRQGLPVQPWLQARECFHYGAASPQTHPQEPVSEDCLFLNVWTPAVAGASPRRPVLVYLHGGEYSHGSGSSPLYDGSILAREQDVVVVTLNHRLSVFGHLALGTWAHDDRRFAGNAGLWDIVLALQWVRAHIGSFGGDASCVTLFGQSGGGAKIACLMAMPAAQGLFHRAVTMSGQQITLSGPQAAQRRAEVFMSALGLRAGQWERLDGLSAEQLLKASEASDPTIERSSLYFGPVLDGVSLDRHPFFPDAAPLGRAIPMVIGGTRDEVRIFFESEWDQIRAYTWEDLSSRLPAELRVDCDAAEVVAFYRRLRPKATPEEVFYAAVTDSRSWRGGVIEAEARAMAGVPAYVYQVNFESPLKQGRLGACHTIDIPLMFGSTGVSGALTGNSEAAQRLSAQTRNFLVRFARTGDPNGTGLPKWAPYDLKSRGTLLLANNPEIESDPRGAQRRFFARFPFIQKGTI